MIRWTENRESYRLDVSFGLPHRVREVSAFLCAFVCVMLLVEYGKTSRLSATFVAVTLGGLASFLLLILVVDYCRYNEADAQRRAWVEVSVEDGRARWGGPDQGESPPWIEVLRFEIVYSSGGGGGVDAALPGSRRVRVFGPWDCLHTTRAEKVVEQLNACLRTPEASAATLDVVPGGVELEPSSEPAASSDPCNGRVPPFRVYFRRMDLALWGAGVPAVIAVLLAWKMGVPLFETPWTPALLGLNALVLGIWFWRDAFWIEVSQHGGPARWGHRGEEWSSLPVVVTRFAIGRDITPGDKRYLRYYPVAILPEGSHARPLRHYRTWVKGTVEGRVDALNQALSRIQPGQA